MEKNELKELLKKAKIEISDALDNFDKLGEKQIEGLGNSIKAMERAAFFDFNSGCK